jgi:hypothetical protein
MTEEPKLLKLSIRRYRALIALQSLTAETRNHLDRLLEVEARLPFAEAELDLVMQPGTTGEAA